MPSIATPEDLERLRAQLAAAQAALAKCTSPAEYAVAAQAASSLAQYCAQYGKNKAPPTRHLQAGKPAPSAQIKQTQPRQETEKSQPVSEPVKEVVAQPRPPSAQLPPPPPITAGSHLNKVLFHNFPQAWSAQRIKAFVERNGVPVVACTKVGGAPESPPSILLEFSDPASVVKAVDALQWQKPDPFKTLIYVRPTPEDLQQLQSLDGTAPTASAQAAGARPVSEPVRAAVAKPRHADVSNQRGGKRERDGSNQGRRSEPPRKQRKGGNNRSVRTDIREAVCPWWEMPYVEQLQEKSYSVAKQLKRVTDEVSTHISSSKRPEWCSRAYRQHHGRCCPLLGILASPVRDGYRNKCEFTIGLDAQERPCVGFLLGSFVEGMTAVADPVNCRHVPPTAIAYAHITTEFLQQHSKLPVWDKRTNHGFWRLLIVREAREACTLPPLNGVNGEQGQAYKLEELDPMKWLVGTTEESGGYGAVRVEEVQESQVCPPPPNELLLMVQVDPTATTPELADKECRELAAFFRSEAAKRSVLAPTVLLLQHHSGCSNAADLNTAPIMHMVPEDAGKPTSIVEALCEFKFRLSATAFFQVNSPATCLLYRTAGMWAEVTSETLLLDICCGTGTIGLSMARQVKKVLGVDCIEAAVSDAEANAKLNGITNCEYVCAKVEDVMQRLLAKHISDYKDVVVIVDPPRNGVHRSVLQAILNCPLVHRMVYVSCNPSTLGDNLVYLCSARHAANAFNPVKAVGVDLFPHTHHVESVVLLQR